MLKGVKDSISSHLTSKNLLVYCDYLFCIYDKKMPEVCTIVRSCLFSLLDFS